MIQMADFLVLNARRYPDKTCVVYRDKRFTFSELNTRVNRLAHYLLGLGVTRGDRVGFMLPNSNQFLELFFASVKIGAIAVPINWRMVPREVKWIADNAACKVFAYAASNAELVAPVKADFETVEHLLCAGPDVPAGEGDLERAASHGRVEEPAVQVDWEDPSHIIFTGGTTGTPKGVLHTHRGAFFEQMNTMLRTRVGDPDEVSLSQLPMFHGAGLLSTRNTLAAGGKVVIVEIFDAREMLRLIEREQVTRMALLPPSSYLRLADQPDIADFDLGSVSQLASAVAGFPKKVMLRLLEIFPNAVLTYGWAATEINNGGTTDIVTREMIEQDHDRIRSIGRAAPFVQIRLVDDSGRDVPLGETGEALVKGPQTMKEYFGQPELTARTIQDGWVRTGDLLRQDAEGFFYFVGRNKDMIKSGGENVFAQEVESVILTHPAVENCAVIGLPDPQLGESVTAVIKLRSGQAAMEEDIVGLCRQSLSSYKKPRRVIFVDTFPTTAAGKVEKYKLVEQYSASEQ